MTDAEDLREWSADGYCQCGCGQKTGIIKETDSRRGWVKGDYKKFVRGHNAKGNGITMHSNGHRMVYCPDHPRASHGYVFDHILKAEQIIGKSLPIGVEIHHHTPEQLIICQDHAYHMLLHQRQRAYEACGHADWRSCQYCHKYDDPKNMTVTRRHAYHKQKNFSCILLAAKAALEGK